MLRLVERVPNFSEGRDRTVIDAITAEFARAQGVELVDVDPGEATNRTVVTVIGDPDAMVDAAFNAIRRATELIDMRKHKGAHPRMGATDVCPFVPVSGITMEGCAELARRLGRRVGEELGFWVYLYDQAATKPEWRNLAKVRQGEYEGLKDRVGDPRWKPDFGPEELNDRAGATAIGAREFLIAYNINLESDDLGLAKEIARNVRERTGGLPRVQALGMFLDDLGCSQVSMNLLDFNITPIWRVWEAVGTAAGERSVELRESELIGLAPIKALLDVADHIGVDAALEDVERITRAAAWLRIRDFDPSMALEIRLSEAEQSDR